VEPNETEPKDAHYFSDKPAAPSKPRRVDISLPDLSIRLNSDSGVFSSDHLDPGTKLLLMEAPPLVVAERNVLDLGCGWGPIACVAATRAPWAQVWALDVNERARALTAANARALGFEGRVHVHAPGEIPADTKFDRILSNPPIRVGKQSLHALLTRWLNRLSPQGVAHLVVQKHLGSDSLAEWLRRQGHDVERISSRAGYRILEVTNPDNTTDHLHTTTPKDESRPT